jgi:hypothetical protein
MELSAKEVANILGGFVEGDEQIKLNTLAKIEEGGTGALSFLANPKYEPFLYTTAASAVIVNKSLTLNKAVETTLIRVDDAYASFTILLEKFANGNQELSGIDAQAIVAKDAKIGTLVYVGAQSYVATKAGYVAQIKDFKGFVSDKSYQTIRELNIQLIESLTAAINQIEAKIESIILNEQQLKRQYDLLQTIPGVGKILAQTFIASTAGFTRFNNPRSFACHAGIAPFVYTSGTSIKSRSRVSHRANKRLKSLLHLAALCSIRVKGELREYYIRKTSEGKSKMSVLNAIRNKIVQRIFAVIKRNSSYNCLELS